MAQMMQWGKKIRNQLPGHWLLVHRLDYGKVLSVVWKIV